MIQQIENYKVFLIQVGARLCISNVRLVPLTKSKRRTLRLYFMPYVNKHKRISKKMIEILNNNKYAHFFTISTNPLIVDEILLKSDIESAVMELCRKRFISIKFIKTIYVWK